MLKKLNVRNREEVRGGRKNLHKEGVQFSSAVCGDLKSRLVMWTGMERKLAQGRNVYAVIAADTSADESDCERYTYMWFLRSVALALRKRSKQVIDRHSFKY